MIFYKSVPSNETERFLKEVHKPFFNSNQNKRGSKIFKCFENWQDVLIEGYKKSLSK